MDTQDNLCVISGESIAIEAALTAAEGTVVAVEYSRADRETMEDNVEHFGLSNVQIVDHVDEGSGYCIYGGFCKYGSGTCVFDKKKSTN